MQYFTIQIPYGEIPLEAEVFEGGLRVTLMLVMPEAIEDYTIDYQENALFIEIKSEVDDG